MNIYKIVIIIFSFMGIFGQTSACLGMSRLDKLNMSKAEKFAALKKGLGIPKEIRKCDKDIIALCKAIVKEDKDLFDKALKACKVIDTSTFVYMLVYRNNFRWMSSLKNQFSDDSKLVTLKSKAKAAYFRKEIECAMLEMMTKCFCESGEKLPFLQKFKEAIKRGNCNGTDPDIVYDCYRVSLGLCPMNNTDKYDGFLNDSLKRIPEVVFDRIKTQGRKSQKYGYDGPIL